MEYVSDRVEDTTDCTFENTQSNEYNWAVVRGSALAKNGNLPVLSAQPGGKGQRSNHYATFIAQIKDVIRAVDAKGAEVLAVGGGIDEVRVSCQSFNRTATGVK